MGILYEKVSSQGMNVGATQPTDVFGLLSWSVNALESLPFSP